MTMASVNKPWMKQPGELFDKKGIPIYPGDLLRSYHFTGARRKRYWLYHVAVMRGGAMYMVPTCHLDPEKAKHPNSRGGVCLMSQQDADGCEILSGYGPGDFLSFEDRPRRPRRVTE